MNDRTVFSLLQPTGTDTGYREQIFRDILRLPELRKTIMELLDKIQFMKDFSTTHKTYDEELLSG
ncbi:hypothetical protein [Ruminococcus sp.]|uniref:hypothetical protein n=1 Tax=Ruminococcus sp. TaxID=41978 RepID=UPI002C1955B2|nr:hypothetical protein [Ruminococcus sp.]HNZ98425.1 hypothetical protein [Ruminococcus sp.]HOH85761.1 hypothetical protein [Ruminococcus sp.]